MSWITTSFLALGSFTVAFLLIAHLGQKYSGNFPLVCGLLVVQAVLAVGHSLAAGDKLWVAPNSVPLLLAAGLLCYLGNLAQTHAIVRSPNPGLALAIISVSTVLVTALSALLVGSSLGLGRSTGIILCLIGVAMIGLMR